VALVVDAFGADTLLGAGADAGTVPPGRRSAAGGEREMPVASRLLARDPRNGRGPGGSTTIDMPAVFGSRVNALLSGGKRWAATQRFGRSALV
jgi:hypothetical protein